MSLRKRLILLWAGALLVCGTLGAELLRARATAERDAGRLVQGYARLLAEHSAGAIRNAELATQGLAAHPGLRGALAAARADTSDGRQPAWPDLEAFRQASPGAISIYVADHQGRVLTATVALRDDSPISGKRYFNDLADDKGPVAKISRVAGEHAGDPGAIRVARRVEDRDGRFLGIVGVHLGIEESFSRLYRSADFPAQATISLWDGQRQPLMRHPMAPAGGQDSALLGLFDTLQASGQKEALGTDRAVPGGRTRIMAVRQLPAGPLLAVVTLPDEAYLEEWRPDAGTTSAVAVALLAGCGLLTLRMRAQTAARPGDDRPSSEQLEACAQIVEAAPVALALVDAELRCVIMNAAFASLGGLGEGPRAGQPLAELLPGQAWEALLQDVQAALDGNSRRRKLQLRRGASEHRLDVEVTPFQRNWRPAGAVLSLRDVTVQRLAEEALMRREAELKAIFEGGPECIKLIGLDGRIQRINSAGLAILEADDLEHGLATRLEMLVDPAHRAAFVDFNARVLRGEGGTLQYRGVGLKGTPRWVETHAVPMRDGQGVITGVLAITRDISALHQTEAPQQTVLA